ncbi:hypothetical protein HSX11_09055 [Oxalobacteraceae bacterium]|nr:hypothetical protein [Oxalobacteraceae bacterium]
MNTHPSPHQKSFRFGVEADSAIGTLEAALAVVRRLNLELCGLRTSNSDTGMEVHMRVCAGEEDALVLCRMRLYNLVGVVGIREMPLLVASQGMRQQG